MSGFGCGRCCVWWCCRRHACYFCVGKEKDSRQKTLMSGFSCGRGCLWCCPHLPSSHFPFVLSSPAFVHPPGTQVWVLLSFLVVRRVVVWSLPVIAGLEFEHGWNIVELARLNVFGIFGHTSIPSILLTDLKIMETKHILNYRNEWWRSSTSLLQLWYILWYIYIYYIHSIKTIYIYYVL